MSLYTLIECSLDPTSGPNSWDTWLQVQELIKDPSCFEQFFQILTDQKIFNEHLIIHRNAAILLGNIIRKYFSNPDFLQNESAGPLMDGILRVISNERDLISSDSIINGLKTIFQHVKENWPQLFQLIQEMINSNIPKKMIIALQILNSYIPEASNDFISSQLEFFISILSTIFQTPTTNQEDSLSLLNYSIEFFSRLIRISRLPETIFPPYPEVFPQLLEQAINLFQCFLTLPNDNLHDSYAEKCSKSISRCLSTFNPPHEPLQIAQMLFSIASNDAISPERRSLLFHPYRKLTKFCGNRISSSYGSFIQFALHICSTQFLEDSCYPDLQDSIKIAWFLEPICESASNESLSIQESVFSTLMSALEAQSSPETFSGIADTFTILSAFSGILTPFHSIIYPHLKQIFEFLNIIITESGINNHALCEIACRLSFDILQVSYWLF